MIVYNRTGCTWHGCGVGCVLAALTNLRCPPYANTPHNACHSSSSIIIHMHKLYILRLYSVYDSCRNLSIVGAPCALASRWKTVCFLSYILLHMCIDFTQWSSRA